MSGIFIGNVADIGDYLSIEGEISFYFSDVFTDPAQARGLLAWLRHNAGEFRELITELGVGVGISEHVYQAEDVDPDDVWDWFFRLTELAGMAYSIRDRWYGRFEAEILKDRAKSRYRSK